MTPITTDDPRGPWREDPVAVERVHNAVSGTESATTADETPEYPTVADLSTATGLGRTRVLDALAILADSETAEAVRRADGGIGWRATDDTEKP
jgi:hypothetical protein